LTWPQRASIQHSQHVVAISQHTRRRFAAANPRAADREIAVCHLGIDPDVADGTPMDAEPMVLTVGRMSKDEQYKGHDALLDAWPSIVRAVPAARMEIAGGGDDRDRLEAKATTLGIDGSVDFLGPISNEERDRCYGRCAVFAMPSRDEGFGFVFLEAMRAARPCVAMEGAASEIVDHLRTGIVLARTADAADLTNAIGALLRDPGHAAAMGRRGRERFLSAFTTAHVEARLADILGRSDRVRITA
jgi:phosphatidylinositol alpha-1,6-mannosyltransferase